MNEYLHEGHENPFPPHFIGKHKCQIITAVKENEYGEALLKIREEKDLEHEIKVIYFNDRKRKIGKTGTLNIYYYDQLGEHQHVYVGRFSKNFFKETSLSVNVPQSHRKGHIKDEPPPSNPNKNLRFTDFGRYIYNEKNTNKEDSIIYYDMKLLPKDTLVEYLTYKSKQVEEKTQKEYIIDIAFDVKRI